jgi:Spy/CpxP family protein refolding chaperone
MTMRTRTTQALLALTVAGAGIVVAPSAVRAAGEGPDVLRPGLAVLQTIREGLQALDLSTDQKARIRQILHARRGEIREAHDRVFAARQSVLDAIHQDTVDEALIRARVSEGAEATAEAAVLRARVRAEVRAVLTAEQRRTADAQRARFQALAGRVRAAVRAFVEESIGS